MGPKARAPTKRDPQAGSRPAERPARPAFGTAAPLESRLRREFALTQAQAKIVAAVTEGLSYVEIAEQFHVSYHTVHTHRKAIHAKLDVHSTAQLLALVYSTLGLSQKYPDPGISRVPSRR